MVNITKKQWKEICEILRKYEIPYTAHYEGDDKHMQINLIIKNFFEESEGSNAKS